jgi:hypothetical protein
MFQLAKWSIEQFWASETMLSLATLSVFLDSTRAHIQRMVCAGGSAAG